METTKKTQVVGIKNAGIVIICATDPATFKRKKSHSSYRVRKKTDNRGK